MALNMDIKMRETQQDNKILVVLIHGLGAPETWNNESEGNWENLILNDPKLIGVDLGIVSYDTSHLISGLLKISGTLKLGKRQITVSSQVTEIGVLARELKRELDKRDTMKYEKIILVGHSMGGLIGIHYLLQEVENGNQTKVAGYMSLATPFNGSALAEFHKLFKGIQNHEQIQQLSPNNDFLNETIRLWQTHLGSPTLSNVSFKFCFGTTDEVVKQNSAIPFIAGKMWSAGVPLPGDHGGILNVTEGYRSAVYTEFRDFVLNIGEQTSLSSLKINNDPSEIKHEASLDVTITHYEQRFKLIALNNMLSDELDLELVLHNTAPRTVTVWQIILNRGTESIALDLGEDLIVLESGISKKKKFRVSKIEGVSYEQEILSRVLNYAVSQTLIIKDNNGSVISKIILDNKGANGVIKDEAFKPINVDEKIEKILKDFGERYRDRFTGLKEK